MKRAVAIACAALVAVGAALGVARAAPVKHPSKKGRALRVVPGHAGKGHAAPPRREPRVVTLPREVEDPSSPHEQRIAELRQRLEEVLREPPLSHARTGIVAMQLTDGDVLFSHNADQRFNPASNTKILTTAAALDRLGGDYRYSTALYGAPPDADGVVGDVALRGSGDPSLSSADLAELARGLAERGVTRVHGDILVDRRPIGLDAQLGDGLIFNRNVVMVRIRPTEPKHAPAVSIEPAGAGIGIDNRAVTTPGRRARLKLDAYRAKDDRLVVDVRGRIGELRGTVVLAQRIGDGALLSGHVLAATLADFGIAFDGRVRVGEMKADSKRAEMKADAKEEDGAPAADADEHVLAVHRSAPLADISAMSNKPSNNFIADAIYKTLGGELFGLPGTLEKGTRAVGEWLIEHGIEPSRFHLVNGSGLTHENRITPDDLAHLLRAIYFEPQLAGDFLPSLAVGGIDGTIRNRFLGTNEVGLVRAKTGTLNGVSALSGYVGDKGDVMVFAILVEGFRHRTTPAVRHAQVRMVDAMMRYLRAEASPGETPHEEPQEATSPEPTPPADSDSTEEDESEPPSETATEPAAKP